MDLYCQTRLRIYTRNLCCKNMGSGIQDVIALKVYIDLLCTRGLNCQGGDGQIWVCVVSQSVSVKSTTRHYHSHNINHNHAALSNLIISIIATTIFHFLSTTRERITVHSHCHSPQPHSTQHSTLSLPHNDQVNHLSTPLPPQPKGISTLHSPPLSPTTLQLLLLYTPTLSPLSRLKNIAFLWWCVVMVGLRRPAVPSP